MEVIPSSPVQGSFLGRFVNNLFGSIAGGSAVSNMGFGMDFIPVDSKGGTMQIKGDNASWLGLRSPLMQKYTYDFCYPVASVVEALAELDTAGEVEILRKGGKGKDDYATSSYAIKMNKLFANPNPLQAYSEFRDQQLIYKRIFGYCPVLPIVPAGFPPEDAVAIINIPPWMFDVVPKRGNAKRSIMDFAKKENLISHYTLTIDGEIIKILPEWVFILTDSSMMDSTKYNLLPQSRLVGLDMAISNICVAMEADNVLLKKKGPLGFISDDPGTKDSNVGYLPMEDSEKAELQGDLLRYGLTLAQFQYVISRRAVRWNPMSFNVAELQTKETVVAAEKAICHRFKYPYVMYEMTDTTFTNSGTAGKFVYQNTVIPNAQKDIQKYNVFFKAAENNVVIKICFDDIPVLQEDKKSQADARKATSDAYLQDYNNNLITKNQLRQALEYDTVAGEDFYKKDEPTKEPAPTPPNPNNTDPNNP